MSPEAYSAAAVAVVLTGVSKSGFAGGLGILGVPLVALTMPPQDAAVLLLPVLLGIDLLSVWRYRSDWTARIVVALLPGAVIGIGLGMVSFADLDPDLLRIAIGLMALVFVGTHLRHRPTSRDAAPRAQWPKVFLASMMSGFAGFVAHAGGPPIKGTLLSLNLGKTAFVATNAIFFFTLNLTKAAGYTALGLFSAQSLLGALSLTPFLVLGVWLGFALHTRVSQTLFVRLAYILLSVAGLNLIVIGVAALAAG
ncbi:MAG: sulfite exporter TauE/SafE family protein [Pseudomonadota bacterium]